MESAIHQLIARHLVPLLVTGDGRIIGILRLVDVLETVCNMFRGKAVTAAVDGGDSGIDRVPMRHRSVRQTLFLGVRERGLLVASIFAAVEIRYAVSKRRFEYQGPKLSPGHHCVRTRMFHMKRVHCRGDSRQVF